MSSGDHVDEPLFDIAVRRRIGAHEVAATVRSGAGLTVLSGPSGIGKTSVLHMIAGLLTPDSGHIRVAGRVLFDGALAINLPPERRSAGYVFQDGRLFPHLSVRANLDYGRRRRLPRKEPVMPQADLVDLLGIGHLLDRRPATLSGGEAQRVAIGRALASAPDFLLMDEPVSAIDPERREAILAVIEQLRDRIDVPILYVTHDYREADRLANHHVVLDVGHAGDARGDF